MHLNISIFEFLLLVPASVIYSTKELISRDTSALEDKPIMKEIVDEVNENSL